MAFQSVYDDTVGISTPVKPVWMPDGMTLCSGTSQSQNVCNERANVPLHEGVLLWRGINAGHNGLI